MRLGWHCRSILETLPKRWKPNKSAQRLVKLGFAEWKPDETPGDALSGFIYGQMLLLTDKGKEYLNSRESL